MDEESPAGIQKRLRDQVQDYGDLYPHFKRYAPLSQEVLQTAAAQYAPRAIVQTRPKSIARFSRNALLKRQKSDCPVHQCTDLCGGDLELPPQWKRDIASGGPLRVNPFVVGEQA